MSAKDNFSVLLLDWFNRHGRHDLPWQSQPADIYRVWISEIMLQQTQVATVIPYFNRFTARFPNLQALASADEQQVLALWSGLGYYARARNLLSCARLLMQDHGGVFPRTAVALAYLPGIGPSTAAAIAATVYGERAAILDGNVKRVLARLTCAQAPWGSLALERSLHAEAIDRLPEHAAAMPAYTQAIMDLGATVCTARNPDCAQCPVQGCCTAYKAGQVSAFPRPRIKKEIPVRQAFWAVLMNKNSVWLSQQASPGIWGGLWAPWILDLDHPPQNWLEISKCRVEVIEMDHAFTHFRLRISAGVFHVNRLPQGLPSNLQKISWAEVFARPLPTPVKSLLLKLCPSEQAIGGEQRKRKKP